MATKLVRANKSDGNFPKQEADGNEIRNLILRNLPRNESSQLFSALEFMRLELHQVMHEAGQSIRSVYFLNNGLGSVLTVQPDGKSVEVGLIGSEGFVGIPLLFGFKTSGLRVVTQGQGTGFRVDAEKLLQVLDQCPELKRRLLRFSMILAMQSTQLAACNQLHDVVQRLARWLLMSQDRIGGTKLPLTQEFLSQMLGSRRASVSIAASALQKKGLISYTRGAVTVSDRPGLEEAACDCYAIIQQQKAKWQSEIA